MRPDASAAAEPTRGHPVREAHVGRYAPSPSGELHLGNARTALLAWLWARSAGGSILLRIEDLDRARVRPGAESRQRAELAALGLDFDGSVVRQSERGALYAAALDRLIAEGRLFRCFCSRADIARAASAPHGEEGPRYPGTCRPLSDAVAGTRAAGGDPFAWRFRGGGAVDDFVVRRRDGVVSYQLAVVVDDADQGVTRILRGDDLASSTPRQGALRRALGIEHEPVHAHVPLLLGPDGVRLSKRHGGSGVREVLESGTSAAELVGRLAFSAGLLDRATPCSAGELIERFSLEKIRGGGRDLWG